MIRSPLFYVGDKYKLMPQLLAYFPKNIQLYVEPFYGGGSSQLAVNANSYALNDINTYIIKIHQMLVANANNKEEFFNKIFDLIDNYGLSCSYKGKNVPDELKSKYPKTYYAKYNKNGYMKLKEDFNLNKCDIIRLYVLLIYGFNHMIRFNKSGDFNLPVGNVDFNKNVYDALNEYFKIQGNKNLKFYSKDYKAFLNDLELDGESFIYLDPPYYISQSEYNKLWSEKDEKELYDYLDCLNAKGIKFGITNLVTHKGNTNTIFKKWSKKYNCKVINSNYISFNDNTIKDSSIELYVYN